MKTDTPQNAQPPVALPPYMASADVWLTPIGVWLAYDRATLTMGYLNALAGSDGFWTLQTPMPEQVFSRLLIEAESKVTLLARHLAAGGPSANSLPV